MAQTTRKRLQEAAWNAPPQETFVKKCEKMNQAPAKRRSCPAAWLLPALAASSCCAPVGSFAHPLPGASLAALQCRMRSSSGNGFGGARHPGALLGACAFGAQPLHGWGGADSVRGPINGGGPVPFPLGGSSGGRKRRAGGAEGPLRQGAGRDWFGDLDDEDAQQEEGVERFLDGLEEARVSRAHLDSFLFSLLHALSARTD